MTDQTLAKAPAKTARNPGSRLLSDHLLPARDETGICNTAEYWWLGASGFLYFLRVDLDCPGRRYCLVDATPGHENQIALSSKIRYRQVQRKTAHRSAGHAEHENPENGR